jgi:hypothetical protein
MAKGTAPVKTKEFDDQVELSKFLEAPQLSTRCSSFFNSASTCVDSRLSTLYDLEHLGTDRDVSILTSRTELAEPVRPIQSDKNSAFSLASKVLQGGIVRGSKSEVAPDSLKSKLIQKWHNAKSEYQTTPSKLPTAFQGIIGPKSNFIYEESLKR